MKTLENSWLDEFRAERKKKQENKRSFFYYHENIGGRDEHKLFEIFSMDEIAVLEYMNDDERDEKKQEEWWDDGDSFNRIMKKIDESGILPSLAVHILDIETI